MKKYLSYGFVLVSLLASGITPVIISSNNIENTVQKNSNLNTKTSPKDGVAPVVDSFEWMAVDGDDTQEAFLITLSDPGGYGENGMAPFVADDFDKHDSSITYVEGLDTKKFEINDWTYNDNGDEYDTITGTATNLEAYKLYSGIILTLNYDLDPNIEYTFSSDGRNSDLDISKTCGESFIAGQDSTDITLPSFTLADNAQWKNVSDDSAEIILNVDSRGSNEDGYPFDERDLNSDLSYVAYDDSAKNEIPYEGVNLKLKNFGLLNNTIVLELSNLDSDTEYNISSIHLVFGDDPTTDDSLVALGNNDEIPVLTTDKISLSGGAIFGIVLGSLIVVGLIAYLIYYFIAENKKDNDLTKEKTEV